MLLTAEWVLPVTSEPIRNGAVAVEGDTIRAVGRREDLIPSQAGGDILDFGPSILMPGLVNAHSHLDYTIMRGLLDRQPFLPWITTLTRLRKGLSQEDMLASARLGLVEAIRSGITMLGDAGETGASCQAMSEAGLRGVFFQEVFGFRPDQIDASIARLQERLGLLRETKGELVQIGISPHAPYTVSAELFQRVGDLAECEGLPLCIHLAESGEEEHLMADGSGALASLIQGWGAEWAPRNTRPVRYLSDVGVLGHRPLLVHCVRVDDEDIALLREHGTPIAHCPKSNAKFGHGVAPLPRFLEEGLTVGLGTDGAASNNTLDLFDEMRFGLLLQRACQGGFPILSARQMVDLATIGAARALGHDNIVGSLEPGKGADLTAVDVSAAHSTPAHDPYSTLVHAANQQDVRFTMVAGKILFQDGRLSTLDEERIGLDTRALASRLAKIDTGV